MDAFFAEYGLQVLSMAVLLAASAFASGTETALFSLTRRDIAQLEQSMSGRVAVGLLKRPRSLLTALLLFNMLVNVAFSATAALIILRIKASGAGALSIIAASVVPLLLLILLGEVTPKMIAYSSSRAWSATVAIPVSFLERVLRPPIVCLDVMVISPLSRIITPPGPARSEITHEELASLMEISAHHAGIPTDTGSMFREIVELANLKVRDVMVPRTDMITCDIDGEPEALVALVRETGLRKVPVRGAAQDEIIGVIYARDLLLKPGTPLADLLSPVFFVPESATLEKVMPLFREKKMQFALVVDEYGSTAGLVTLEDILEEIVGDIRDRHEIDTPPTVQQCGEDEYRVTGDLAIHEWVGVFKIEESVGRRIHTFAGLVAYLLGRIPSPGDTVRWKNLSMTVESVRRRRAERIRLTLTGEEAE